MPKFEKIVSHYIELLDASISRFCDRENAMSRVAQIDSDELLKATFSDGCIVFSNLSCTDLDEIIKQLVEKIVKLSANFDQNSTRIEESKFCAYCSLAKNCLLRVDHQTANKALGEAVLKQIAMVSIIIFSNLKTPNSHDVQKAFQIFFGVVGNYSSRIFDIVFANFQNEMRKSPDPNVIQNVLSPFIYLSSSIESLAHALEHLIPAVHESPDNCRSIISQIFVDLFTFSIKSAPYEFLHIYQQQSKIAQVERLLDTLQSWDKKSNGIPFIARCSTLLTVPQDVEKGKYNSDFDLITTCFDRTDNVTSLVETYLNALNAGFLLVSETQKIEVFGQNTQKIFNSVLNYTERAMKKILEAKPRIQKFIFVNFGLALYFYDQKIFLEKFLNMLLASIIPTKGNFFCKFISRLCNHRMRIELPNEIIRATIQCIDILTKPNMNCMAMRSLFKGFVYNTEFLETLMRCDYTCIQSIITAAYNNNLYQLCIALLKFFNPERLDGLYQDNQMWNYILNVTTSISSIVIVSMLYQTTTFTDYIPEVTYKIAQFVFCALPDQSVEGSEDLLKRTDVRSILNHFEIIALSLMVSSTSDVTKTAVSIINEILNILHQAGNYESITMPFEAYQTLVTNCKNRSSTQAMDPYFIKSLVLVKNQSSGIQTAWNTIYKYFLSALNVIAPDMKLPDIPERKVNKPVSVLHDELPNCFSIIMSLLQPVHSKVIDFVHGFLKDGEFVGQMAVDCLPAALLPTFYNQLTKLIQETIDKMQTTPGVFDVTTENNIYIKNAMKVLRNLLRQPFYYETPVDSSLITKLIMDFTGYCNLVSITDYHILCAHLIVAAMSYYSKDVDANARRQMTNSLGWWLSKPDFSMSSKAATTVLLDALSKLLDGLEFPEQQYLDKFKFFVNIATTVLKAQPKLKNEIQAMLTSLFRSNINTGIVQCISDCLASSTLTRTTFLLSYANVLKKPEPVAPQKEGGDHRDEDLIDILFETRFQLIETLMDLVPFSRAEAVGINLLEAAVLKDAHYELMDFMIKMELKTAHEASKNAIFRGNGVASRAVGHFPRLFGQAWMTHHLRPLFNSIIEEAERGTHFQINPAKIGEGQDIEQNRRNFRTVLRKAIDTILHALKSIPNAIIRVIQILYKRINECFDGLGIHIVFGFVFLRFILPAFSVTALVGLPPLLPEEPRACLLTISVILMGSATKGSLNEKGDHFIVFNDIAAEVHESFKAAIQELIDTDLKDATFEEVEVDKKKVIGVLEGDFSEIRRQLETKIAELSESDPLRKSAEKLNQIVKDVNKNKPAKNEDKPAENVPTNTPALDKFLKNEFKAEPMQDLGQWFYKETHPPADNLLLYHINNAKLPHVNDPTCLFHHIFKMLKIAQQNYWIMADFSVFDKTQFVKPSQLAKYVEMAAGIYSKLNGIIVVNACDAFLQYLVDSAPKFQFKKLFFVKSPEQLTEKLGAMPKLTGIASEIFTTIESIHTARLDNAQVFVRLHNKSLQVLRPYPQLPYDAFSIQIYMFDMLMSPTLTSDGFTYQYKSNTVTFQTTEGSNLYSLLVAAVNRVNQKQSTDGGVTVDRSSVQWLLLNIAFASLISSERDVSLNYAAMQLVISTYNSFEFTRTSNPADCPEHLVPSNCRTIVASLSRDLAAGNLKETKTFMQEFFKMKPKLPADTLPDTIPFLGPWVENLVRYKLDNGILTQIINFYFNNQSVQNNFNSLVWSTFVEDENIEYLFGILKQMNTKESLKLVNFVAQLNYKFSSRYWVNNFDNGTFAQNALHSLLMADAFHKATVPDLLVQIINVRDKLNVEQRIEVSKLLNNLLAMLTLHSSSNASNSIKIAVKLYAEPNEPEFEPWAGKLCALAGLIATTFKLLGLDKIKAEILAKFMEKLNTNQGSVQNYIGVIFCSALYTGLADTLVKQMLRVVPFGSDDNNHVLCYSFSLVNLTEKMRANIILIVITRIFTNGATSALTLLNCIGSRESFELLQSLPQTKQLEELTELPLSTRPFYSLAMILAAYDEKSVCKDLVLKMYTLDPAINILAVAYEPELHQYIMDIQYAEEDWPTIAAITFATFMKRPELDEPFIVVKKYIEYNSDAFGCFSGYQELEKRNLLRLIHDNLKILEFGKIYMNQSKKHLVHKVVAQIYSDTKNKPIPTDVSKQIIQDVMKNIL